MPDVFLPHLSHAFTSSFLSSNIQIYLDQLIFSDNSDRHRQYKQYVAIEVETIVFTIENIISKYEIAIFRHFSHFFRLPHTHRKMSYVAIEVDAHFKKFLENFPLRSLNSLVQDYFFNKLY